jgi:NAD(P)-dependent dehydrogenase (short-subunit alcohol dehydrogenase family)
MTASPSGTGPVALVTAAADGIGKATALAFGAAGYRLMLVDVDPDGLASTATAISTGAEVQIATADVTNEAHTQRVVAATTAAFGTLDALVNVVGGSRPGKTVVDLSLDEWDRLVAVNLTSVFLMCRAALPTMEAAGSGAIVNVSSGAGLRGMHANPGYVAAKAGVAALTRALALDHGPAGIRVNCVAPGPIRTALMRRNRTPEEIRAMGQLAILGRIGEPEEIAQAILWLAGDGSSYLTGQTLEVDGGVASPV